MTTTDTTYNGWANYATWNLSLWANNDDGTQRDMERGWDRAPYRDEADARALLAELFPDGQTGDGVRVDDPDIDWHEIVDMLNEAAPAD